MLFRLSGVFGGRDILDPVDEVHYLSVGINDWYVQSAPVLLINPASISLRSSESVALYCHCVRNAQLYRPFKSCLKVLRCRTCGVIEVIGKDLEQCLPY